MNKIKSLNLGILSILKYCLMGLVATLVGTVIFAVILKFADIPNVAISYINNVIKAISIFVIVLCIKKNNDEKVLFKSILGGAIYAIMSFVVFSILNGSFSFGVEFISDFLFAIVVSAIAAVVINLLKRKNI